MLESIHRANIGYFKNPKEKKGIIRASTAVSQNWEQKPFLDANVKKRCSSSGAIPGAIIWRLNRDQPYLGKNG